MTNNSTKKSTEKNCILKKFFIPLCIECSADVEISAFKEIK